MTPDQPAQTTPAPFVSHGTTAHGLAPDKVRLHHDEHGAAWIFLDADGTIEIRIQVGESRHITPERHAAELERDRRGLRRLAAVATQLAQEIEQRQREGGAQ